MFILEAKSEMTKCILLTVVLGYGAYMALYDMLNPKIVALVSVLYFGTAILSGIIVCILVETGFSRVVFQGVTLINIVFLVICVMFFIGKRNVSPIPLYTLAGIYGAIGILNTFRGFAVDAPIEIARDVFMLNIFALLENLLVLALLVLMAYTLSRKRKLVV